MACSCHDIYNTHAAYGKYDDLADGSAMLTCWYLNPGPGTPSNAFPVSKKQFVQHPISTFVNQKDTCLPAALLRQSSDDTDDTMSHVSAAASALAGPLAAPCSWFLDTCPARSSMTSAISSCSRPYPSTTPRSAYSLQTADCLHAEATSQVMLCGMCTRQPKLSYRCGS